MKNATSPTQLFSPNNLRLVCQAVFQTTYKSAKKHRQSVLVFLGLLAAMVLFQELSFAGTDGDDFDDIYTRLAGWSKGTLGKVISLGMFLVGLATGVVKQDIMAVVVGLSGALSLYYGPTIIDSVVSAII